VSNFILAGHYFKPGHARVQRNLLITVLWEYSSDRKRGLEK
jgi:hypothetical protein